MDWRLRPLVSLVLFLMLTPALAWLDNFDWRQNSTLNFVGTHDSYVRELTIDTASLISSGNLQADCDDFRPTNATDS